MIRPMVFEGRERRGRAHVHVVVEDIGTHDAEAYARYRIETQQGYATLVSLVRVHMIGRLAVDAVLTSPRQQPPMWALQRYATRAGTGHAVTCAVALEEAAALESLCRRILGTFWLAP